MSRRRSQSDSDWVPALVADLFVGVASLLWQAAVLVVRYWIVVGVAVCAVTGWMLSGSAVAVGLGLILVTVLVAWRLARRDSFNRWIADPIRFSRRRAWYREQWGNLLSGHGLTTERTPQRGTSPHRVVTVPRLHRITCSRSVDRLTVRPLVGQSLERWEKACEPMALAMGVPECRIAADRLGWLRLEVVWGDPLAHSVPPLPAKAPVDLAEVSVGVREDGKPWSLRLTGNHLLIAGVTGSGKSSVIWALVNGIAPAVHDGSVQLWGIDPKGGMEFQPGRPLFIRLAAGDVEAMADLFDDVAEVMRRRASRYAEAHIRRHVPTVDEPLIVVMVDEMAFLTAYLPDRKMRDRISNSVAVLLTQGRAVGICVVAALQDPRKEVIGYRNLFPTKIALRLDEKAQVDMVLGDGARDAGARCDRIPDTTPGVAYVKVDGIREPVRVRAAHVTDHDIATIASRYPTPSTREGAPGGACPCSAG